MHTCDHISFNRITQLMSNELQSKIKPILLAMGCLALFLIFFPFVAANQIGSYVFFLFVGGIIITNNSFSELHQREKSSLYLTLPCNNLERLLSKWLLTSIGYALGLLAFFFFLSSIISAAHLFFFKKALNLSDPRLWTAIINYTVVQSLFLLGAVTFKKYSLLKTIFFMSLFVIVLTFVGSLILSALVHLMLYQQPVAAIFKIYPLFLALFTIICISLAYLRISKYELK